MKLSRRGKHTKPARRGKHTKRAGKHLRYKGKKVRGSKRYSRGRGGGRVRTYKRGRRFQRGGDQTIDCKFTDTPNTSGYYTLTLENKDLFFTKKGVLIQGDPSQKFKITLEVVDIKSLFQKDQSDSITSLFVVTFTRNNRNSKGQPIKHTIRVLSYFTNPKEQATTIAMIQNPKAEYVTTYYNFFDPENQTFFKEIQSCIITKLIDELNKFKVFLVGCKIRIFSLSIKDAKEYGLQKVCNCLISNQNGCLELSKTFGQENIFLSFFDCIYVNDSDSDSGDIDKEKTLKQVSFIPFHRLAMFTSIDNSGFKFDSDKLMRDLRIRLKQMMENIIKGIDDLTTAKNSNEYDTASSIIIILGRLVNRSVYRQFISDYIMGSERSKASLSISSCDKIDEGLAKFVIEKSKDKADKEEYRDYDGAVDYIPPDLLPPSTASG